MNKLAQEFEPRNLFRNIYFWLAVGGLILLIYVGFIAFTFLPKTTSEITDEKARVEKVEETSDESDEDSTDDDETSTQTKDKTTSSKGSGELSRANFIVVKDGGWVSSEDQKMTIVIKAINLKAEIVNEIVSSNGIEIVIDGIEANIINVEPYKNSQLLARADAVLAEEKFDKFSNGETQNVKIDVKMKYREATASRSFVKHFTKMDKTDVEGVRINWKKR